MTKLQNEAEAFVQEPRLLATTDKLIAHPLVQTTIEIGLVSHGELEKISFVQTLGLPWPASVL